MEVAMKVAVLFVSLCLAARAQTPPPPTPDSSLIQALLSEVHQLRLAIERSNTLSPRIQLVVERVKMQQSVVTRLSDQLESTRRELDNAQSNQTRAAEHVKNYETELSQVTDPMKRQQMDLELKVFKPEVERTQQLMEALRGREADLSSRLRSEQATLDGLNDRLNQIERTLSQ
jgi:chromosome segregation ATPase